MARRSNRNDAEENRLRTYEEAKLDLIQTLLKQKVNKHSSGLLGVDGGRVVAAIMLDAARLFLYISQHMSAGILRIRNGACAPTAQASSSHTAAPKYTRARCRSPRAAANYCIRGHAVAYAARTANMASCRFVLHHRTVTL